jgi:hypothetical protein
MSSKEKGKWKGQGTSWGQRDFIISLLNEGVMFSLMSLKKVTQCCGSLKGCWVIVQKWERERDKAWQLEGFRFIHVAVGKSCINPGQAQRIVLWGGMCWILPKVLVGLRRNLPTDRRRRWPESSAFGYSTAGGLSQQTESIWMPDYNGHFPGRLSLVRHSRYWPFILERRGSYLGCQDVTGMRCHGGIHWYAKGFLLSEHSQ